MSGSIDESVNWDEADADIGGTTDFQLDTKSLDLVLENGTLNKPQAKQG
ncbi:hypothetical protein MY10362_002423 [Beauveria mimosiformis]